MAETYSLKDIVNEAYHESEEWIDRIHGDGINFCYETAIEGGISYPSEFNRLEQGILLRNVVGELTDNALKSIFQVGKLEHILEGNYDKTIFDGTIPSIRIELEFDGEQYTLTVSDNGPGMDLSYMEKMWNMGESQRGSNGIGLYNLKKDVEEKFDGSVSCESKPGEETTFTVKIPSPSSYC